MRIIIPEFIQLIESWKNPIEWNTIFGNGFQRKETTISPVVKIFSAQIDMVWLSCQQK